MSTDDRTISTARWIDNQSDVVRFAQALEPGPVAVDTEADSFHHYREKVCLIQISTGSSNVILDPLAGIDLEPLRAVFEDRGALKIMHGADYDLRLLDRDFRFKVCGLFDTMIAARLTGERAYGLAALLDQHLGVKIDKTHQLADWSQRPLPDEMVRYAAGDTCHLLALHALLARRLEELGRSTWAEEEFLRLENVRWTVEADDPERFRKVKGAARLGSRALAVLSALHLWRDRTARRRDVPVFRVLPDAPLVSMAHSPPSSFGELAEVRGLPRRLARGHAAREILERVGEALAVPEADLPEVRPGRARRQPPPASKALKALRAKRDDLAAAIGIEGSIIASRATLEAVVARVDSGEDWRALPELRQWQIGILAPLVA